MRRSRDAKSMGGDFSGIFSEGKEHIHRYTMFGGHITPYRLAMVLL